MVTSFISSYIDLSINNWWRNFLNTLFQTGICGLFEYEPGHNCMWRDKGLLCRFVGGTVPLTYRHISRGDCPSDMLTYCNKRCNAHLQRSQVPVSSAGAVLTAHYWRVLTRQGSATEAVAK